MVEHIFFAKTYTQKKFIGSLIRITPYLLILQLKLNKGIESHGNYLKNMCCVCSTCRTTLRSLQQWPHNYHYQITVKSIVLNVFFFMTQQIMTTDMNKLIKLKPTYKIITGISSDFFNVANPVESTNNSKHFLEPLSHTIYTLWSNIIKSHQK